MSEEDLTGLYRHPKVKAYVTTTHGEGFGLPIFEAACNELPVIAPDWSGQRDFLHGRLKSNSSLEPLFCVIPHTLEEVEKEAVWESVIEAGSKWCNVSVEDTSTALNEVYKNLSLYKKKAKALKKGNDKKFAQKKRESTSHDLLKKDTKSPLDNSQSSFTFFGEIGLFIYVLLLISSINFSTH